MLRTLPFRTFAGFLLFAPVAGAQHVLYTVSGDNAGDTLGNCCDILGDANGDGYADLLAGAWRDDNNAKTDSGSVRVVSGKDGTTLWVVDGDLAGDHMGWGSSGAGDIDGDGRADFAAAADEADLPGKANAGIVKLVLGSATPGAFAVQHTLQGVNAGDFFGWSTARVGDVDLDGVDDVLVGALNGDATPLTNCGTARLHSGATGALLYQFAGDAGSDQCGYSVGGAGDVDNDGVPDLIVGIPGADPSALSGAGRARVLSGATGLPLYTFAGDTASDSLGLSVDGAGDLDLDGYADLIVGVPGDDGGGSGSGSARLYRGVDGSPITTLNGDSAADALGDAVRGLGDVDGDGYPDFAAGAPGDDNNGSGSGSLRVWSGRTLSVLYTLNGDAAGDALGTSIGAGGDVDADGFADVLAGATGDDNNGSGSGSARAYDLIQLGVSHYGSGTPGCAGKQLVNATSAPVVGNAGFAIAGDHVQPSFPGFVAMSSGQDLLGSDPLGLGILLHVGLPPAALLFSLSGFPGNAKGSALRLLPIPSDATLAGVTLYFQGVSIWPAGCPALGANILSSSIGMQIVIAP